MNAPWHVRSFRSLIWLVLAAFLATLLPPVAPVAATPSTPPPPPRRESIAPALDRGAVEATPPYDPGTILPSGTQSAPPVAASDTTPATQITPPIGMTERIDLRTRTTKVFMGADGQGQAYAFTTPIHYQTPDGRWEEIDNRLIPDPDTGYGWRNAANDAVVRFAVTSPDQAAPSAAENGPGLLAGSTDQPLVAVTMGAYTVRFQPLDATAVRGHADGATIVYPGIYPNVDLRYWVSADQFKEDLVFHTRPAQDQFTFLVDVQGSRLAVDASGALVFADCTADCPTIAAPFMEDAQGVISTQIGVTLLPQGPGRYLLTYALDPAWLDDPARAYPVVLDPTTQTASAGSSMYVQEGFPTTVNCNSMRAVFVGYIGIIAPEPVQPKQRTRGFFHFNLPTIPPGSTITNASFYAYQYLVDSGGGGYNTNLHRATVDWHNSTVCGLGSSGGITWNTSSTAVDTGTTWTTGFVDTTIGWKGWGITNLAQQWNSGTYPNHGFAIYSTPEVQIGSAFCSATPAGSPCFAADGTAYSPYAIITFTGPAIITGLTLTPSTQAVNADVGASFTVRNDGPNPSTFDLRVSAAGAGDFTEVTGITLAASGGTYDYAATRSFGTVGAYPTCAQYRVGAGAWQNLPEDGGVACATLNIVSAADVQLDAPLTLTPNLFEPGGGTSAAAFTVRNTGTATVIERFRARVTSGSVTFAETVDVTLLPNQTYTYNASNLFTQAGVYEVIAEHQVGTAWLPLIGQGSGFIRVKQGPPPPLLALKGTPKTAAYCGEPVNSAIGNYVSDFTDMRDPTPGLPLAVTRWYNAIDADTASGPFGFGTSWLASMQVTWRADKSALVQLASGEIAYYLGLIDPLAPTDLSGVYESQGKDRGTLVRAADGSAVLTMPDQTAYAFDPAGRIIQIRHPYPATIDVIYTAGRPSQLVHSAGVTYTITYTGAVITRIESSSGQAVSYAYSGTGDLTQVTLPDGAVYRYTYDANHRLIDARDPNNNAFVRNTYNAQGRVTSQLDQAGESSVLTYGLGGAERRSYTDALGQTITHVYDADLRVIEEIDAQGRSQTYVRDVRGNITQMTDRTGAIWRYTYDVANNLLSETNPLSQTTFYTYDLRNNRTSQTNPLGQTTLYAYDSADRLISMTDSLSQTFLYAYDNQGNLIYERDPLGAETWHGYNSLGLQTVMTDTLGFVTRMEYDAQGNITRYTDANGHVAQSVYDARSRLTRSVDPMGTQVDFTYDPMGNLLSYTDGMGHTTTYQYDLYDRLIAESDWNGHVVTTAYDTLGRRIRTTDPLGFTTIYTYNQVGELVAQQQADGAITTYTYDAAGRVTSSTDPLSRTTTYRYDAAGRQIEVRRPCSVCAGGVAISQTFYDAAGRVIREVDPRGAVTTYTHDALGRVATRTLPNGGVERFTYDAVGREIQRVDALGGVTRTTYDPLGRVLTVTDPLGRVTTNQYDNVGNLIKTIDPRGNATSYTLDANDRQIVVTDSLSQTTRMEYDAQGRMTKQTDALGQVTRYSYDANGNQLTITDRTGAITRMQYDALNRVVQRTDALGGVWKTTYDSVGRVIRSTDALSGTTSTTYDAAGRRIAEQDVLGFTRRYTYDAANNLVEQQEPTGAITRYRYDAGGLQIGMTDALNYTRVYTYDLSGNRVAEQNERGFVTTYEYDLLNRQVVQVDPLGNRRTTTYDAAGQTMTTTDYNGNLTTYAYDPAGNQIRMTDALNGVTTMTYDAMNRMLTRTDALGRVQRMQYDALGRTIQMTSPAGNGIMMGYDAEGRVLQATDPLGQSTRTAYDVLGRTITSTDALSRETTLAYDALGRTVASTDALGRTTRSSYDAAGRVLTLVAPNGVTQRYTYDAVGNVLSEHDGGSFRVRYEYDLMNRMVARIYNEHTVYLPLAVSSNPTTATTTPSAGIPLGRRVWRYAYDGVGNQISMTMPTGRVISMAYDALNRLSDKHYDGDRFARYSYDANGNRIGMTDQIGATRYTYDALNRLTASTDPAGRVVRQQYDAVGQRTQVTYPDGGVTRFAYNADGVLNAVTAPDAGVTEYTLDALNRPTRIAQANGVVVEQRYDVVGNLLEISQRGPGGSLFARHAYTVDALNRRVQQVAVLPQGSVTTDYTYDDLDRLVQSTSSDGSSAAYTFDTAGNRLSERGVRVRAGVSPETYTLTYQYSLNNELLVSDDSVQGRTAYSYNADGFRVASDGRGERARYRYDAEGHLIEARVEELVGSAWLLRDDMIQQYAYDGNSRRVRLDSVPGDGAAFSARQEYRYDDLTGWDVLQTYDSIARTSVRAVYDRPLHKLASGADSMNYFQNDGLGSVLGATTPEGNLNSESLMRYGDYGQLAGPLSALSTADGYTGYELDRYTGLNYARNRYYDTATGTFLTSDPFPGNRSDVGDLHRYLYVQANPLNSTDPLGLFNWSTNTVEAGDTLWAIAMALGTTVNRLVQLNPQITNRNLIYPGQRLNLPAGMPAKQYQQQTQQQAQNIGTGTTSCGKKASCGGTHIVQIGENLSLIGVKYGITWKWIYESIKNIIGSNPNLIKVGLHLSIPCMGMGNTDKKDTSISSTGFRELDKRANKFFNLEKKPSWSDGKLDEWQTLLIDYVDVLDTCLLYPEGQLWCEQSNAEVRSMLDAVLRELDSMPYGKPLSSIRPTAGFHSKWHIDRGYSDHYAQDFSASEGTTVYATVEGEAISSWQSCGGNVLEIRNEFYTVVYAHMKEITVSGSVKHGQIVGKSGNTGTCIDGAHLHYEISRKGVKIDPMPTLTMRHWKG